MANASLHRARKAKNDEFYTQLTDVEKELRHYRKHFKGATVLCNCDDPFESNFFKYFVLNFNRLGLKKLIATCYEGSAVAEYRDGKSKPYKAVVTTVRDTTGNGGVDMEDVRNLFELGENELVELQGDGDFRSEECLALLDEADVVVTNPPFSLFREYVAVLMEHRKKFVIIGNMNAITYKEIFPLLKDGKMWTGQKRFGGGMDMIQPSSTFNEKKTESYRIDDAGNIVKNIMGVIWYTNLDIKKRHEELILVRTYAGHEDEYPKYDNYDAIEVSKVANIPLDYDGVMGMPITFLDKYNPDQFEIIGLDRYTVPKEFLVGGRVAIDGKPTYARILIRNKHPEQPKEVQQ
uniref:adenine-specific methyltransferase EcoRI family protein n=1 Tax=Bifidobacterium longum TaxID=216816 RepID=UPI00359C861C